MADGNGMRVDLSALNEVVNKLNTLVDGMTEVKKKATYSTDIPQSAFGKADTFLEAGDLFKAHQETKSDLESAIAGLERLIDKFGTSTSKAKDKYHEQEYANKSQMNGGSGKWD